MAQPIYFDNFGRALKARAAAAPYLAAGQALEGITGSIEKIMFAYQQKKEEEKQAKMQAMSGIIKAGMGPSMGPAFAQEFEKSSGIKLPRDDAGNPFVPGIPAKMKPAPSPEEMSFTRGTAQLKADATERTHELDRRSHETTAAMAAGSRVKAAEIGAGAKEGAQLTGVWLTREGRMLNAGQYQKHPDKYPGAYELSVDMLKARSLSRTLRNKDAMTTAKLEQLHRSFEHDASRFKELSTLFNAAVKVKDEPLQKKLLSTMLNTSNKTDNIGVDDKTLQDVLNDPRYHKFLGGLLGRSASLADSPTITQPIQPTSGPRWVTKTAPNGMQYEEQVP